MGLQFEGFLSYAHFDNKAEKNRILSLAKDIAYEFELCTGESLSIYCDENLKWGEEWAEKLDEKIQSGSFFIPIVTPKYFKSESCRKEIVQFDNHAKRLGRQQLILPLLYVALLNTDMTDEVYRLVTNSQYIDWTNLRLESPESSEYRKGIAKLVGRLIEISKSIEDTPIRNSASFDIGVDDPGALETFAKLELEMPNLVTSTSEFKEKLDEILYVLEEFVPKFQAETTFAQRLALAGSMKIRLSPLAHDLAEKQSTIRDGLELIDKVVDFLVADVADTDQLEEALFQIFQLGLTLNSLSEQVSPAVQNIKAVENLSSDLRPVFRSIRNTLAQVVDYADFSIRWNNIVEQASSPMRNQSERKK